MDAGRAQTGGQRDLADREPLPMGGHDGPDALLLGRCQAHGGPVQALREVAGAVHPLAQCLCSFYSYYDTQAPAHLSSKLNGLTPLSVPLLVLPRLEEALSPAPPTDLGELCARARLEEDEAHALARSGALHGYIPDRRQALWTAPLVARAARERWLPRLREAVDPPVTLPRATEREDLAPRPLRWAGDLAGLPVGTRVEVAGQVISRQRPPTARVFFFLGLSDEWGLLNVVVPPEVYERDRAWRAARRWSGWRGSWSGAPAWPRCARNTCAPSLPCSPSPPLPCRQLACGSCSSY